MRERGDFFEIAEITQFRCKIRRIQEAVSNDGLDDSNHTDRAGQDSVGYEELSQIFVVTNRGISHKYQRYVVEIQFEAHQPVEDVRGIGIKDLKHAQP